MVGLWLGKRVFLSFRNYTVKYLGVLNFRLIQMGKKEEEEEKFKILSN